MNGPFSYLGASLDAALNAYVMQTVRLVCAALSAPFALALTISLVARGTEVLRGRTQDPVVGVSLDLALQAAFVSMALSAGLYMSNVVATANGLMNGLMSMFSSGTSDGYAALDQLEAQGATIATHYMALGVAALPTGGYVDCGTGLVMACVIGTLLMVVGGYFTLAKVALALVLAIGPLFVGLRAFAPTAHLFSNWLNKLLNYVILMALMTATVALLNSVYGSYLSHLSNVSDDTNPLADTLDLAVLSGAIIILALQVPRISAALTSGSAVGGSTLWLVFRAGFQQMARDRTTASSSEPPPAHSGLERQQTGASENLRRY
jgi:type IV secretion system protein VirB6